jgi:3-deoxy-D-manno-octulosonic-acid transferase
MIMPRALPSGLWGLYIRLTILLRPLVLWNIKRRLQKGKEDAKRVSERYGIATHARPEGPLIWLHAVGLGEVMALRGMIPILSQHCPDAHFLVTSGTRQSADVFSQNLPECTLHQYLPLDVSGYCKAFLAHWKPDLCIWSEQELWPNMIWHVDQFGIPQVIINARMNAASFQSRHQAKGMFADIYGRFALISAQDEQTAAHISSLGATVQVDGSLKPLAPALQVDQAKFETRKAQIGERPVLCLASSHPADEDLALSTLGELSPETLLIIVPRRVERSAEIADKIETAGFSHSVGDGPIRKATRVHLVDQVGQLGLWYRLCSYAFIGGGFDETQGHNPWEAVTLNRRVFHGPNTANFKRDYENLNALGIALQITSAADLVASIKITEPVLDAKQRYLAVDQAVKDLDNLGQDIIAIMDRARES